MDYIPRKDGDLLVWLANYKTKIAIYGATLGVAGGDILAQQVQCDQMMEAITELAVAKDALKSKLADKTSRYQTAVGFLRTNIARQKQSPSYTATIGEDMGVVGTGTSLDTATYKAQISGELFGGFIRIKFKKMGADGVNIYHRKKGDAQWQFLARDTKSPYDDHIVLANPAQPEHWEYRAYGVLDDAEIGQASDIVEMVFGG